MSVLKITLLLILSNFIFSDNVFINNHEIIHGCQIEDTKERYVFIHGDIANSIFSNALEMDDSGNFMIRKTRILSLIQIEDTLHRFNFKSESNQLYDVKLEFES